MSCSKFPQGTQVNWKGFENFVFNYPLDKKNLSTCAHQSSTACFYNSVRKELNI
jgi:hypothetical protein